jgi:hypothetical protein
VTDIFDPADFMTVHRDRYAYLLDEIELLRGLLKQGHELMAETIAEIADLKAEREACAVLCETSDRHRGVYFADKIRARGEDLLSKTRSHDAARQDVDDAWEQAIK